MKINYDPKKNEKNIRERGLSFDRAADLDFATASYFLRKASTKEAKRYGKAKTTD